MHPGVRAAGVDLLLFTTLLIAGLSAAAGGIHGAAFPDHATEHWLFGVFFAGSAVFQLLWGLLVVRQEKPTRALLRLGLWANAAFVLLWIVTRTVGVPIGPERWMPEAIGLVDSITVVFELALIALCLRLLRPNALESLRGRMTPALAWAASGGASVLAVVGLSSARRPDHMQALTMGNHGRHLLLAVAAFSASYALAMLRRARPVRNGPQPSTRTRVG